MRTNAWNGVGRMLGVAGRVVADEAGLDLVPARRPPGRGSGRTAARAVARTASTSSGTRASWPVPTTRSTYGARLRISSWSFWAMHPSTPMTVSGLASLSGPHPAERGVRLLLGVLADGAGVEQDHVGVGRRVGEGVPLLAERARRPARCRARSSGSRRFRCRRSSRSWVGGSVMNGAERGSWGRIAATAGLGEPNAVSPSSHTRPACVTAPLRSMPSARGHPEWCNAKSVTHATKPV